MTKREMALARIKYSGYHQNSDWIGIYTENRVSYEAAKIAYRAGYAAKIAGMKCNCQECNQQPAKS